MLNCWYHHILMSFVSKILDLCFFYNRFGEDCCCSEIYFKLTWTLRQIAFELLHFLQLCATAIPLLKSRFIMELSAPARSISSLCIGMNHRNVNLDSEFPLHFWKENSVKKFVSRISPGTQARYACLLSFDAKNYEAKQFLVQKFAAGQSVMMTVGQPGQNAPLGPGSTFSCRAKFHRHRYEEEKHYGLRSSNYFIFLTSHLGEWQLEWVLRGKHISFSLRATSHNEITKMKGSKLPLISSYKTWKWKRTNGE